MPIFENDHLVVVSNIVLNKNNEILLLFRKDHAWFETPGGKVEESDCANPLLPTSEDFHRAADRELREEVGSDFRAGKFSLFVRIEFTLPDGRKLVAYKFTRPHVSGEPRVVETTRFSHVKWVPLLTIESFPLSPDLKELVPKLKTLIH